MRRLLEAGVEVLAAKGYHAARVDDVVRAASTSHGTFYRYFANKDDLFRALLVEVGEAMGEHAESLGPLTADDAGREELRRWLVGFARLYDRFAPVVRAWVEAEMDTDQFGRVGADVLAGFAGILTERIEAADGPVDDPASAAIVVVAMIERANYYAAVGHLAIDPEPLADSLAAAVHAALFGISTPRVSH
ncbi:MAG: TetR/AcrR family transcriptional regulator [Acidimicrobiia bacterium]|nr:TetR/AcrR family transcriptional regulator [Acidimicrobiia bacterium]